jgi:hypothetical protein
MSRKIDRFIKELVDEDMISVKKLNKKELFVLVRDLKNSNYRELHNDTIVELYENTFHTYVRSAE